jgi:hypothetical protein
MICFVAFFKIMLCKCYIKQEGESCYCMKHDPDATDLHVIGLTLQTILT